MQAFQSVLSMLARMHVLILFASVSLLKPMLSFFTPAKRQHFHTYAYHCQKKRNKRSKKQIVLSEHFRKCGRIKFSPRTMVVEHTATRKNDQLRRDTNSKF